MSCAHSSITVRIPGAEIGRAFATVAQRAGLSVTNALLLGKFLHVDFTRDADEMRIRTMLVNLGATIIRRLPGDCKGRHLDDSTDYRLVATIGDAPAKAGSP